MTDYSTVPEAVEALKAGKVILVIDDPDRENEGDFICAAQYATTENVNFMASHAKGLICMPMSEEYVRKLQLPQMVAHNTDNHETAFTVSIDHVNTTTGISAEERGYTARMTRRRRRLAATTSAVPATCSRCSPRKTACSSATATPRPPSTCCRLAGLKQVRPVLRGHARRRHDDAHVRAARRGKALRPDGHHDQGAATLPQVPRPPRDLRGKRRCCPPSMASSARTAT